MPGEVECFEEGRGQREGMNRRTDIMGEARQGQRRAARTSADVLIAFDHLNAQAPARQRDGRREPVGSAADDHSIILIPVLLVDLHTASRMTEVLRMVLSERPKKWGVDRIAALYQMLRK